MDASLRFVQNAADGEGMNTPRIQLGKKKMTIKKIINYETTPPRGVFYL